MSSSFKEISVPDKDNHKISLQQYPKDKVTGIPIRKGNVPQVCCRTFPQNIYHKKGRINLEI